MGYFAASHTKHVTFHCSWNANGEIPASEGELMFIIVGPELVRAAYACVYRTP
jgi:hypothetical protein